MGRPRGRLSPPASSAPPRNTGRAVRALYHGHVIQVRRAVYHGHVIQVRRALYHGPRSASAQDPSARGRPQRRGPPARTRSTPRVTGGGVGGRAAGRTPGRVGGRRKGRRAGGRTLWRTCGATWPRRPSSTCPRCAGAGRGGRGVPGPDRLRGRGEERPPAAMQGVAARRHVAACRQGISAPAMRSV